MSLSKIVLTRAIHRTKNGALLLYGSKGDILYVYKAMPDGSLLVSHFEDVPIEEAFLIAADDYKKTE